MRIAISACVAGVTILLASGCHKTPVHEVVLYSSIDETYARRAADLFKQQTGITVKLVNDTESAKSTGLLVRLIAEKNHPVADVFWSGDLARTLTLDRTGMLEAFIPDSADTLPPGSSFGEGHIFAASARARVIMVNRELSPANEPRPRSVEDLAGPDFASRACIANPLFGTTGVHAAALFRIWGEDRAKRFFEDFTRNGGKMLASNGEVKRRVGSGEFAFGLTDSDDLNVAWLDGKPVDGVIPVKPEEGGLLLPSAAVLIRNAPHRAEAARLAAWLSGPKAARILTSGEAAYFPAHTGLPGPENFRGKIIPLPPDAAAWVELDTLMRRLSDGFLTTWVDRQR